MVQRSKGHQKFMDLLLEKKMLKMLKNSMASMKETVLLYQKKREHNLITISYRGGKRRKKSGMLSFQSTEKVILI